MPASRDQHYLWKGDAAPDRTKRSRARRWFPIDRPCDDCGGIATERHHVDGDPGNNVRENIALLCARCHRERDGRLAAFIAYKPPIRPPGNCKNCGRTWKPLVRGRCKRCAEFLRRNGCERPAVLANLRKYKPALIREKSGVVIGEAEA